MARRHLLTRNVCGWIGAHMSGPAPE